MAGAQAAHAHLGRSPPVGANKNGRHPAKFEFQTNNKYLKNICLKYCSRCTYAKKLSSVDLKFEPTRASCIIGDPPTLIRAGEILPKAWPPDALPCSPLGGRTEWALRGGGSPEFRARVAACGGPQRLSRGTRGGGGRARGAPRQRAGCRPEAELCQGWGPTRPVRWGPAGAVAALLSHPRGRAVPQCPTCMELDLGGLLRGPMTQQMCLARSKHEKHVFHVIKFELTPTLLRPLQDGCRRTPLLGSESVPRQGSEGPRLACGAALCSQWCRVRSQQRMRSRPWLGTRGPSSSRRVKGPARRNSAAGRASRDLTRN
ncbi:uncharacterized protein [Equus asinus]|uniref:uncharacterized protein n=1 Tax=Equus asinus TaxID=9793 RepID=UPI0038F7A3DB